MYSMIPNIISISSWNMRICRVNREHVSVEEFIRGFGGKARRKETTRKTWTRRKIILKFILKKYDGVLWTGLIYFRLGIS
jgi:hypothetical protein